MLLVELLLRLVVGGLLCESGTLLLLLLFDLLPFLILLSSQVLDLLLVLLIELRICVGGVRRSIRPGRWRTVSISLRAGIRVGDGWVVAFVDGVIRRCRWVGIGLAGFGLNVVRRGLWCDLDIRVGLRDRRLYLANLRNRQRPAAIGLDRLLLLGKRRRRRRWGHFRNHSAILQRRGRPNASSSPRAENSVPRRSDRRCAVTGRSGRHFGGIDGDRVSRHGLRRR